jgi:hypothetical protein
MAGYFADPTDGVGYKEHVVDLYHVPTGKSVRFKGWVTNFADSYSSNWNTEDAYGRMDPISTFQNTVRSITLDWDVVAASLEEARDNMAKCELLFAMLYPTYDSAGDSAAAIKASPLFKLKYSNLIGVPTMSAGGEAKESGLLGSMGGFEYSPDFDAGFFVNGAKIYPQKISLSAEFQVLHNFKVGWDANTRNFRTSNYPYGGTLVDGAAEKTQGSTTAGSQAEANSSQPEPTQTSATPQQQQRAEGKILGAIEGSGWE